MSFGHRLMKNVSGVDDVSWTTVVFLPSLLAVVHGSRAWECGQRNVVSDAGR
jgi:hypothetical protein